MKKKNLNKVSGGVSDLVYKMKDSAVSLAKKALGGTRFGQASSLFNRFTGRKDS